MQVSPMPMAGVCAQPKHSVSQPRFGEWGYGDERKHLKQLAENSAATRTTIEAMAAQMPQLTRMADSLETIAGAVKQYANPDVQDSLP